MQKTLLQRSSELDKVPLPLFGLVFDKIIRDKPVAHKHVKGQLLYAIAGLMHVYIAGRCFIVPPSKAVWIPSLVPHAITSSSLVKYRSLYFDCKLFPKLPKTTNVIQVSSLLQALILRACEFSKTYQRDSAEYRLACVIVDEITSAVVEPFSVAMPKDKRLQKLFSYLERHLLEAKNIEVITKKFGLSSRTLTRLCKKEMGLSFEEWRTQLKLVIALGLLAEGHSTSHVAQSLGYSNDSAFIAMFKRMTGAVPSAFRKGVL